MSLEKERVGLLLVLAAVLLWATVGISVELVPEAPLLTSEVLAFIRSFIGGAAILVAALVLLGPQAIRISLRNFPDLAIFAVANAIFQVGLFQSFDLLGVSLTAFLTGCLPPVIIATFDILRRTGSTGPGALAALALSCVGLGLVASAGDAIYARTEWMSGLTVAVLTSVAFVAMSHAMQGLGRTMRPMIATGVGLSASGLLLLPVASVSSLVPISELVTELSTPNVLVLALYIGLVPTALAFLLYCKGIAMCRSALSALIVSTARPAAASILSIWILAQMPTAAEASGCALLLGALVILWQSECSFERKRTRSGPCSTGPD